jgi:hypothetical protein
VYFKVIASGMTQMQIGAANVTVLATLFVAGVRVTELALSAKELGKIRYFLHLDWLKSLI